MSLRQYRSRVTHDRWLVSYADFITLLFAFFVVLFAASKADQKKQILVSRSIDSAFRSFGVLPVPGTATQGGANEVNGLSDEEPAIRSSALTEETLLSPGNVEEDFDHIRRELEQKLSEQIALQTVSIQMGRDGLVISLREAGFFRSGSAAPKEESIGTLREIAASLDRTAYNVRVEGHTDNIPIHTEEFDSNWELSSARATRIARIFLESKAIAPERLSAAGYAEFHPAASNSSAEGRAQNRRVDLVVLPQTRIDFSARSKPAEARPWRKITDDD
jgi:chemotaxis protein MotB